MNSTVYVYGNLGSGYTQYPSDYAHVIFVEFMNRLSLSSSQTEIAVYRADSLMYYGYVRKLAEGQCIGFCVLLNGVMQTDFEGMFALFENAITHLVVNGELLQFNLNGDIVSKVNQLCHNQNATNQIIDFLKDGFHKLEVSHRKLPPVSYGVSSDEVKQFSLSDNIDDIVTATHTYRYSYISKDKNFNTRSLNSYKGVVSRLNGNCKELSDELIETRTELAKIKRQKKQFRYVLILLLAIMGCAIGLFSLNDNLNITQGQLNNANSTNSNLRLEVDELKSVKIDLLYSLSAEKKGRKNVEFKLKQVAKYMPIIVTNVEIGNTNNGVVETDYGGVLYSASTMYLSPQITYTGVDINKSITLNIRFYTSAGLSRSSNSPEGYTYSSTMFVNQGNGNKETIGGWGSSSKGNWSQGVYRIEIWYDDICLKSKEFIIY